MLKRNSRQHDSFFDTIYRFRGVILVVSIPLLLISFVLFLMPRSPTGSPNQFKHRKEPPNNHPRKSYAVIFNAGSSGSRVHVFCFDERLDLVSIAKELELFRQKKPGLSAFAKDPQVAAESLMPLLEEAEIAVPKELRRKTPVRVGAAAGLRALGSDTSDRILQAVRDLLKGKSALKSQPYWVTVLDGSQEGSFQWVTINYLLGNLGKKYSDTVGVVDLGGGSVQMAYAISEADAAKAPRISNEEDTYVKEMYLMGAKYHLYVHSYLRYGLLAARAEILKFVGDTSNPCILTMLPWESVLRVWDVILFEGSRVMLFRTALALMEMVKQDNRRQLSAKVEQLEQEVIELRQLLADKQEQEHAMLQVLMQVEQEQRVAEDARIFVEQDAAAQRYAAQVLQEKYEESVASPQPVLLLPEQTCQQKTC